MDLLCFFSVLCLPLCKSVYMCLVVTCLVRADLLAVSREGSGETVQM